MHRRQRANPVYVDMVKSGIWGLELADGGLGVDLDFGTLTHQAYARPVLNVLVHAGPDILGGDEALHIAVSCTAWHKCHNNHEPILFDLLVQLQQ